jgi:hypothetical protein
MNSDVNTHQNDNGISLSLKRAEVRFMPKYKLTAEAQVVKTNDRQESDDQKTIGV